MGWVSDVSVGELLEPPLPRKQSGYAALVFVVSRAEGDGAVHGQHLVDWSSLHDVTGRHIAVITPDPTSSAVVEDVGVALRGHALFGGARTRLVVDVPRARSAVYAPRLPMPVDEHAIAVTTIATALQEYFGIAEEALPCAVIACTSQRQVVVVGLNRRITVYGLLKQVKSLLEPELARLHRGLSDLEACAEELARAKADLAVARGLTRAWRTAVVAHQEWADRRARLARELLDLATHVEADTAALCRWLAGRLPENRALDRHEAVRAERLFTVLSSRIGNLSSRERRSLLRRLRRSAAALGTDAVPVPAESDTDVAGLTERVSQGQAAYDALSFAHAQARSLDMVGAVRSAVDRLGLVESDSGLLPWREVRWPVTMFIPPPHRVPSVRADRG